MCVELLELEPYICQHVNCLVSRTVPDRGCAGCGEVKRVHLHKMEGVPTAPCAFCRDSGLWEWDNGQWVKCRGARAEHVFAGQMQQLETAWGAAGRPTTPRTRRQGRR